MKNNYYIAKHKLLLLTSYVLYTLSQKQGTTFIFAITLANVDRF